MFSSLIFIVVVVLSTSRGQGQTSKMVCGQFCEGEMETVGVLFRNSSLSACAFDVSRFAFSFQAAGAARTSQICFQSYPQCNTADTTDNCTCSIPSDPTYDYEYKYTFHAKHAEYQGGTFGFDTGCLDGSFNPVSIVDNSGCVNISISQDLHHFGILGREIAVIVVVTIVVFAVLIFVQYVYIAYRQKLWPFNGKGNIPKWTWWQGVLVSLPLLLGSLLVISIFIDYYGKVWLFGVTGNCLRKKEDAMDVPKGLLIFLFVFGILCIVAWAIYMIVAAILKKWPFD